MSGRIQVDPDIEDLRSPVTRKALRYWRGRCGDGPMPRREDIDPADLKAVLPSMCLLSVLDGGRDFLFRLIGTRMREFISGDYTGMKLSDVTALQPSEMLTENFLTCIEMKRPILANTPYVGPKKEIAELEDVIMPLSEDGVTVDRLMIVVDFRFKLDEEWG